LLRHKYALSIVAALKNIIWNIFCFRVLLLELQPVAVGREQISRRYTMKDGSRVSLLSMGTTRRQIMTGAAALAGMALPAVGAFAATDDGVSHSADAIHQEPVFKASPSQLYSALTDPKQFDQVVHLSAAMKSMAIGNKLAEISGEVGGAFALFGGYITGRHLELVPNQRIVQAWRTHSWDPGDYSIVRFDFVEQGSGTKIVFDHKGFPLGQAEHLAAGWKANYWEPLEKYLGKK
jgi:activator of HSP90 ATPase